MSMTYSNAFCARFKDDEAAQRFLLLNDVTSISERYGFWYFRCTLPVAQIMEFTTSLSYIPDQILEEYYQFSVKTRKNDGPKPSITLEYRNHIDVETLLDQYKHVTMLPELNRTPS